MIFAESYYSIHSDTDSEQHKRFFFHDKNDQKFLISGVNSVNWEIYRRAHPNEQGFPTWGWYQDNGGFPQPIMNWGYEQMQYLESWNMNVLGPWCHPMGTLQNVYWNGSEYTPENFWANLLFYQGVNDYYYREYPYTVIIQMVPDYVLTTFTPPWRPTFFDYLPDVWSEEFRNDCILRAYLMLAYKTDCNYSDSISTPLITDDNTLVLPYQWYVYHNPQGLKADKNLIGVFLGNDAYWNYLTNPDKGLFFKFYWGRKIMTMACNQNNNPPTPGKKAFARIMENWYSQGGPDSAVDRWNANYAPTFHINSFDDLANNFYIYFPETSQGENDLKEFLKSFPLVQPNKDIGWFLNNEDRRVFMDSLAERFYAVATQSIRWFDTNHLIFSDRYMPRVVLPANIQKSIATQACKYCDALSFHVYPEHPGWFKAPMGPDSIIYIYNSIPSNWKKPFIMDEITVQADYERGWDICLTYQSDPLIPNKGIAHPCGNLNGQKDFYCDEYSFYSGTTETGCLNDRGTDCDHILRNSWTYTASNDDHFLLGYFWAIYYDLPITGRWGHPSITSDRQNPTQNWGIVNPWCLRPQDCSNYSPSVHPVYDLVEQIKQVNFLIQCMVTGNNWCNDPTANPLCDSYTCQNPYPGLGELIDDWSPDDELENKKPCNSDIWTIQGCN